jgi:hypothetical protein
VVHVITFNASLAFPENADTGNRSLPPERALDWTTAFNLDSHHHHTTRLWKERTAGMWPFTNNTWRTVASERQAQREKLIAEVTATGKIEVTTVNQEIMQSTGDSLIFNWRTRAC